MPFPRFKICNENAFMLAKSIVKFVNSVDEVNFAPAGENSLFQLVCNDIKGLNGRDKSVRFKLIREYKYNKHLRSYIKKLLDEKHFNKFVNVDDTDNLNNIHNNSNKEKDEIEVIYNFDSENENSTDNNIVDGKRIEVLNVEFLPISKYLVTNIDSDTCRLSLNHPGPSNNPGPSNELNYNNDNIFNNPGPSNLSVVANELDDDLEFFQNVPLKIRTKSHNLESNSNIYTSENISIKFTESEWEEYIYDKNKKYLKTQSFMDKIREKFSEYYSCIINCKNSKIFKRNIIIYTYKCRQSQCNRFYKFNHIIGNEKTFKITFKGNCLHTELLSHQLRGRSREELKKKLLSNYASDLQNESIQTIDIKLKENGNLMNFKGLSVLNTARSEALKLLDDDKDDLIDLQKKTLHNKSIHQLSLSEFCVYILSPQQIDVLFKILKTDVEITIHIDSTGSIIRHPKTNSFLKDADVKQIYYYAIVVNVKLNDGKTGINYPVCEMITENHTSHNIEMWLRHLKYSCKRVSNVDPLFKNVVSDFSKANLNAICSAWNDLSLNKYLDLIYENISDLSNLKNIVFIHLCYAHLIRNFERFLKKYFTDTNQIKNLMFFIKNIINAENYEQTKKYICILIKLCTEPNYDQSEAYLIELELLCDSYISDDIIENLSENSDIDIENKNCLSNFEKNKFYQEFRIFYENIIVLDTAYGCTNNYYNPKFIEDFLKYFIPFIPMWSKAIFKMHYVKYSGKNFTNAPIESYFGELKHQVQKNAVKLGKPPIKVGRFINFSADLISNKTYIILNDLPRVNFVNKSRKRKSPLKEDLESWNKKRHIMSQKHFSNSRGINN